MRAGYLDLKYHFLLDHQLWLRMAALAPMVYTPQMLAYARFHPSAKNKAQAAKFGDEIAAISDWMEATSPFSERVENHTRQIQAGKKWLEGYYLVEAGQPVKALKAYWQCMQNSPLKALSAWRRVLLACFNLLGGSWLRPAYDGIRTWFLAKKKGYPKN